MKKFVVIVIVSLIICTFCYFYHPIVNRLSSDFDVQINNCSGMVLDKITIRSSGDTNDILNFSLEDNEINKYKVIKDKLTKNTSYFIHCEVNNKIYESEMISYGEKYNFSNITILIKNIDDGQIKFAVYKKID